MASQNLLVQGTITSTGAASWVQTIYEGGYTVQPGVAVSTSISLVALGLYQSGDSVTSFTQWVPNTVHVTGTGSFTSTVYTFTTTMVSGNLASSLNTTSTSLRSPNQTITSSPTISSANPTGSSTNHSKHLSSGAIAGLSIGCAIIGALLALLPACFVIRRKSRDERSRKTVAIPPQSGKSKDVESPESHEGLLLAHTFDLPQPLSEAKIVNEMSQLGTRIKNHATNFYNTKPIDPSALGMGILSEVGMDPKSGSRMLTMLASSEGRVEAIRYLIARKIFECIQMHGDPKTTFLPEAVVECMRNLTISVTGDGKCSLHSREASIADFS
jgi:hypothetical protein